MSINWLPLAIGILAAAFGYLVGYLFSRRIAASRVKEATALSTSMLEDARKNAESLRKESDLEARNKFLQMKVQFEEESKGKKESLKSLETQLSEKDSNLERKLNFLTLK
jgi:ribonuclease Y